MSFTRIFQTNRLGVFFIAVGGLMSTSALAAETASASKALEVRRLVGTNTVDFDRDVVPALRANCLPCHNKSTTKGDLLLESPADMIKGGETGPALQPGKAAESLLFKLASHTAKPRMPPRENKVNAVELTPQQLGLLAAWIDQGARPSPYREEVIAWQPLAPEIRPIFALAAATDGSCIAASHGNRIDLYSLPNLERIAHAVDPSLTSPGGIGIAHRDQVNALAMSPNGEWLASGGFREVKVWRRSVPVARLPGRPTNLAPSTAGSITSPDGSYLFTLTNGVALLSDARRERFVTALHRDRISIGRSLATEQAVTWIRGERDSFQEANEAARKELDSVRARHRKAVDTNAAADRAVSEKQTALEKSRQDRLTAETDQKAADAAGDATPDLAARKKSALELAQKTAKEVEKLESELKVLQQKQASAKYELELALPAVEKVESTIKNGEERKIVLDVELGAAERANQAAIAALTRPTSPPISGVFSPDSRWLAVLSQDGRVHIWRSEGGYPGETIPLSQPVRNLAFLDSKSVLVETTDDGWFSVGLTPSWALNGILGSVSSPSLFVDRITALAFSPDGRRLAIGGGEPTRGGDISIWDATVGVQMSRYTNWHSDTVLAIAWSPDGRRLVTGGADRFARILDLESGKMLRTLEGHSGHILGIAWSPDGRVLATASADNAVKLWDAVSGDRKKQATGFPKEVTALTFWGAGRQLVAAAGDGELQVLNENAERGQALKPGEDFIYAVAGIPEGGWLAAGGHRGVLRVWQLGDVKPRAQTAERVP